MCISIASGHPSTFTTAWFPTNIWSSYGPIQLLPSQGKIRTHCLVASTTDNFLGEPIQINNFIESLLQERLQPELECQQAEKIRCIKTDTEQMTANMLQSNLNPIAAIFLLLSNATVADLQLTLPVLARQCKVVSARPNDLVKRVKAVVSSMCKKTKESGF